MSGPTAELGWFGGIFGEFGNTNICASDNAPKSTTSIPFTESAAFDLLNPSLPSCV